MIGAKAHFDSWWALASEAKGELKDVISFKGFPFHMAAD